MTVALAEPSVALDEGDVSWSIDPTIVGPASRYPRMAEVREIRPKTLTDDTDEFPAVQDEDLAADEIGDQVAEEPQPEPDRPDFTRPVPAPVFAAPLPAAPSRPDVRIKPDPVKAKPAAPPAPEVSERPEPAQLPASAPAAPSLWSALKLRISGASASAAEDEEEEPPSLAVLVIVGGFAVAATAAAFILSFTMLLLVVKATGWTGWVAHIGPLVPDVAACAAAVMLVARINRFLAWSLLIGSTGMSIVGNLAGHAIESAKPAQPGSTAPPFPEDWIWVGNVFSVFMPVVMAFLVHASMELLAKFLAWNKRQRELEQERLRAEAEEQARVDREEKERREREDAAARAKEAALADLPEPSSRNKEASSEVSVQYGVAHEVHTPARLRTVLTKAGWKPKSETQLKTYCKEIKRQLGVAA